MGREASGNARQNRFPKVLSIAVDMYVFQGCQTSLVETLALCEARFCWRALNIELHLFLPVRRGWHED